MNFRHSKNLCLSGDGLQKVQGIDWSPNLMRIAVAQADKRIALYDENGEKKETFQTKPFKGSPNYVIVDVAFSPDSTKLAIAQSDNIVFIYHLGTQWGERKTINKKLEQTSPITCMIWPRKRSNEIFLGLAEGKVKVGTLKNNSSSVLYTTESYVVSLAMSPDNKFLLSGHLDGVIYKFHLENSNLQKMAIHPSIPYCLTWGTDILAAGNDYKVVFYNDIGTKLQTFDYSHDEKLKEFTVSKLSPSGDCIAVGNHNKFFIFLYNNRKQLWEEACINYVEGLYSVTALCWKSDGSALITGNICGSVDLFEACLKKILFKEKFEVTYVSHSQVVIKNIYTNKRLVIKPTLSTEMTKFNFYLDNFVIIYTKESIILGDLDLEKCSEIGWNITGSEKFDFSNPNVCMVYSNGELALVEYGNNNLLGYCRTEFIHSNLISVRLSNHNTVTGNEKLKIIAYLIDLNTIVIQDLNIQSEIATIHHENKIDFLELNKHGNKLIFRDRNRQLFVYYINEGKKYTLLNYCGFVQWVPNSEVLVAQERKNLCVWYNVEDVDKVKIIPVKGEVEEIRRREGKTEVIVEEGNNSQIYLLDDGLIAFSTALDENNINLACKILENLEMNTDTENHWKTLAKHAIQSKALQVAQRCYAAIGNYSKANYVKKILKIAQKTSIDNPLVEAKLLILDKQFNNAKNLLLKNNLLDEAMEILNELQKWDESVKIAMDYHHPDIDGIKEQYFSWLLKNDQLDKAAELKEQEGEYLVAIDLYIKGGYPAKAANLVNSYDSQSFDNNTIETIIKSLMHVGIYEKAGELLDKIGHHQRAIEAYQEARCYSKAVEVARKHLPSKIERLEEEWGDYLFTQKQIEAAIAHFIEAGVKDKAIEACIQARKWEKAIELANSIPLNIARPYLVDIGSHYAALRDYSTAEKYFIKAQEPIHAFNMYVRTNKWDKAEAIIQKFMKEENDFRNIIVKEAMKYEQDKKFKEAEKLYIIAGEHDIAINMYKTYRQFDNMIRLVSKYRPDFLKKSHSMVAEMLEVDGNFKLAESHYLEGGNWKRCVEMYRINNMWEDALRVAKLNAPKAEINELGKRWVANLPEEEASRMLMMMGLVDARIDIECEKKNFEAALKLAEQSAKYKIPDIYFKYAMLCEDEKRFADAEEYYIKAGQVQEAIQMYQHIKDFQAALRVSRQHDPSNVPNIYMDQAKFFLERGEASKAEMCFIQAKKPEYMIKFYLQNKRYQEALNLAKKYAPTLENDIRQQMLLENDKDISKMSGNELLENAKLLEDSGDFIRAIDYYLEVGPQHFNNEDTLQEIWEKALSLALNYDKGRCNEIVTEVCLKLKSIKRFDQAARLYEKGGNIEDAVKTHIEALNWDDAHRIVNSLRHSDLKTQLNVLIERAYKQWLRENNKDDEIGDYESIVRLFEKGQYSKVVELAGNLGPEILNDFLTKIIEQFVKNKEFGAAAQFLADHATPIFPSTLTDYENLASEILAEENLDELKSLKDMMGSVMKNLDNNNKYPQQKASLAKINRVTYYQYMKFFIKPRSKNLPNTFLRLCLTVLAFGDIVKMDVALLDAGLISREMGLVGDAFLFLNRYLDFYEVIDDDSLNLEPYPEFKFTDIDIAVPYRSTVNILTPAKKEELHRWIVTLTIDKKIEKVLTMKSCSGCSKSIYDGNVQCPHCKYQYGTCLISGYPINNERDAVSCSSCKKKAIRECWKEWINEFEKCPNCNSVQMAQK